MKQPGPVHTNTLAPPDLFWRSATVLVLSVGIMAGAALAAGPVVLLAEYRNVWLLFLLPLVAAGAWIVVRVIAHWRKLRWHYAHLSTFSLLEDRIESLEWPHPFTKGVTFDAAKPPRHRTIPLDSVTSVVASFAIVRQTMNRWGTPNIETAPVLYVRYDDGGRQELLSVPFSSHKHEAINKWLGHFAKQGIPLQYTARFLFRHDTQVLSDGERLDHLATAPDVIPYIFDAGWQADEQELGARWLALRETIRHDEEELDPKVKDKRSRHSARTWW